MTSTPNPFAGDPDRAFIWEMLMPRDFKAFTTQDWSMVAPDFDEGRFFGIDANKSASPDDWKPAFPTLAIYREEWLRQAAEAARHVYKEPLVDTLPKIVRLDQIDIRGTAAIAHKKFSGDILRADGSRETLAFQTLYFCGHAGDRWRITGFAGYLFHAGA
ncbi:hypothetical protein [Mesorhizobium marinum]|uniref:hypothetical protein n=1 Tax=Mesorhizobium marinum TaxID=3228790 RepID=UPI003465364F